MTQPVFRPTASFQQWEKEKLKYSFLHPFYWYGFIITVFFQNVNQFSTRKNIFVETAQTQDSIFVHFFKKQVVRTRYKRQPCPDRLYHMDSHGNPTRKWKDAILEYSKNIINFCDKNRGIASLEKSISPIAFLSYLCMEFPILYHSWMKLSTRIHFFLNFHQNSTSVFIEI